MIKELQYVNIRRVLDDLTDHPLLRDLTLEQVVRHTIRFIGLHGFPRMYQDKIVDIDIHEFRGLLPCDLISIIQVKDLRTGTCLRAMTDNFTPDLVPHSPHPHPRHKDLLNNVRDEMKDCHHHHPKDMYIPPLRRHFEEMTFKTQGRVIFTSFPEGKVGVAYKAIPVDEDGYPLLLDNENYLAALEAYIKEKVFMVKFDTGKISAQVLQNAKQEYAFLAGELMEEFLIPSQSEMEALTRSFNTLIPRVREFDKGFKHLGDREWLRKH